MKKRIESEGVPAENLHGGSLPYERFLRFGPENLTEAELLAIILRTGTRDRSALDLAEQVLGLAKYPRTGLLGLYDVSLKDLMEIRGIGQVKAVKLKCLTELSMRMAQARAQNTLNFRSPSTIADYYMERLRHMRTECVLLICLDGREQLIAERKLSDGCVNMALISPREVFIAALQAGAVSIVLVHNHPSGNPEPGSSDRELTEAVYETGRMIGISLLDHIIIGDNRFFSFCNEGLLK